MRMRSSVFMLGLVIGWSALLSVTMLSAAENASQECRRLSVAEYRNRMEAAWIGQIVGVSWGAPTEFRWGDKIIPEADVPAWKPEMINDAFGQDDIYVEMTFLRSLEQYGLEVSAKQAGIDFANSEYPLWCANAAGRANLRDGIAPPDSGHPKFNKCPNDIDYQIEADYSGIISPGLPNRTVRLGETFGRMMNYGDGLYAGQFIGALYAEAFFATGSDPEDIVQLVNRALKSIPAQSQYAEMVRDMVAWYQEDPTDWQKCWTKCQAKYRENPEYQKASNGGIDAKINGAYVLMGLLFGEGDIEKTIVIAMRSGQDSDCNPSSAAGVLFTMIGRDALPVAFNTGLLQDKKFLYTAYTFPELTQVCEKLTRQILVAEHGGTEGEGEAEIFVIPVTEPRTSAYEESWNPGPTADTLYTEEEMGQIHFQGPKRTLAKIFPGWTLTTNGSDMGPGMRDTYEGKTNVYMTHPLNKETGAAFVKELTIPAEGAKLRAVVGVHKMGEQTFDWKLVAKVNGNTVKEQEITATKEGEQTNVWTTVEIDLSAYAGQTVQVELWNQPTGWSFEAGYWAEISLVP
ncbi:MAG: ADP-ribosylglycohydrolase family protein [Thermoguttaceae bacterium]|nr:ADP-ribosylglycohydrolase family protein [Thermoguttaceae bacterium]